MEKWTPTPEEVEVYEKWASERPESIRAIALRLKPWLLYEMLTTGQLVSVHCISESTEGVTLQVTILPEHNHGILVGRRVFGVSPDDLVVARTLKATPHYGQNRGFRSIN